jgi:hypothetical protein
MTPPPLHSPQAQMHSAFLFSAGRPATAMLMLLLGCVLATTHAFLVPSTPSSLSSSSSLSFSPGTSFGSPPRLYPGQQCGGSPSRGVCPFLSVLSPPSCCPSLLYGGWLSSWVFCKGSALALEESCVWGKGRTERAPRPFFEGQGVGIFLLPSPRSLSHRGPCSSSDT